MRVLRPVSRHRERCSETRSFMSDYLDGELGEERSGVEHHLRWCPNCRRMLANLERTVTTLRRLGGRESAGG